ncbi:Hypothetical_protein [Hexamita inflata]|uniref:Hypothetical_protein n=1 Tax=Hexamita inflata TaxID=28002 RepID=A0AA86RKK9_9EUKA|nr:Hypothetical protein HINF_LOCUS61374 [Hexamita inflata]
MSDTFLCLPENCFMLWSALCRFSAAVLAPKVELLRQRLRLSRNGGIAVSLEPRRIERIPLRFHSALASKLRRYSSGSAAQCSGGCLRLNARTWPGGSAARVCPATKHLHPRFGTFRAVQVCVRFGPRKRPASAQRLWSGVFQTEEFAHNCCDPSQTAKIPALRTYLQNQATLNQMKTRKNVSQRP